ncbi:MAG: 50S ribosomal protein L18Ae [Candidatus Micrarchaeota archaeon]|nr:50S ribosomal protein L18Ae [Candidatus Micrarchaeota archaeon]
MKYKVSGIVKLKGGSRKFSVEMEAGSEKHLRDKVLAYFGSKYKVKRSAVEIAEVKGA